MGKRSSRKRHGGMELAVLAVSLLALGLGVWIMLSPVFPLTKPYRSPVEYNVPAEEAPGQFEIKLDLPPSEPETFQPTANASLSYDEQQALSEQSVVGEPQPEIPPSETGGVYHMVTMCVSPSGVGTVYPPEGTYRVKEGSLTIQVMSVKSGYRFEKWVISYDSKSRSAGRAMFKTIKVRRDLTITAVFEPIITPPEGSVSAYGTVVVDFAFYDKIAIAPAGTVECVETGQSRSLTPVEVTPNEWHGQCDFADLEVGKTYTFSYTLTNGCKLSGTFSITIKRSVEYYHQGFPYGTGASINGWLVSILDVDPKQAKEIGGVLALASAPIVVASALSYVRKR